MKKLLSISASIITIYIFIILSLVSKASTTEDTATLSLTILPGTDSIYAPILINHGTYKNTSTQISEYLWDDAGANLEFIEFDIGSGSVDLDISASITNNFTGQNTTSTFDAHSVEIKGCKTGGYCDADNWPDKRFGTETPDNCIVFYPGNDTTYNQIGTTGVTLVDDGVGGIGSNCTALNARWRFIPATKILIPANTTPDLYNADLTFTLTTR